MQFFTMEGLKNHVSEKCKETRIINNFQKCYLTNRKLSHIGARRIRSHLSIIRGHYGYIENNAVLHLIDKAKDVIQESISTLDNISELQWELQRRPAVETKKKRSGR